MPSNGIPPAVFVRVGYLDRYDRRFDSGLPLGGGTFNLHSAGSEVENFRPFDGDRLLGYAQTPSRDGFNVARFGTRPDGYGNVTGALVIMVARTDRGQVIAGWYRNATVHASAHPRGRGRYSVFNFETKKAEAVLLPATKRVVRVPKGRGAMGQANVFYLYGADGSVRRAGWIGRVIQYVMTYDGPNLLVDGGGDGAGRAGGGKADGQGLSVDPAERKAIEREAMRQAAMYFRGHGFRVDTEAYRRESYDLLCIDSAGMELRVEVKGTVGDGRSVLMTAPEVASAKTSRSALVVVSELTLVGRGTAVRARGGVLRCWNPWKPHAQNLAATEYRVIVRR